MMDSGGLSKYTASLWATKLEVGQRAQQYKPLTCRWKLEGERREKGGTTYGQINRLS